MYCSNPVVQTQLNLKFMAFHGLFYYKYVTGRHWTCVCCSMSNSDSTVMCCRQDPAPLSWHLRAAASAVESLACLAEASLDAPTLQCLAAAAPGIVQILGLLLESTELIALHTAAQLLPCAVPALADFAAAHHSVRSALAPGAAADWQPVKLLLETRLLFDVQQHAAAFGKLEAALAAGGGSGTANSMASPSVRRC